MQLRFDFKNNKNIYNLDNFIIHDGNRDAFDFATSFSILDNNFYLLSGNKGSGKTYICKIWNHIQQAEFINDKIFQYKELEYIHYIDTFIKNNKKYILEDLDKLNISEKYLFYLLNTIMNKSSILLITSTKYSNEFVFELQDLQSRFNTSYNLILKDLDEEYKSQIILKLFMDKQLNNDTTTLTYISQNISNNYEVIINFVNKLEKFLNISNIKKLTIKIIKELLDN